MKLFPQIATVVGMSLSLPSLAWAQGGQDGILRILPLGDSLTSGVSFFDDVGSGGYRTQLEDNLEAAGIEFDFVGFRAVDGEGGGGGAVKDPDHEGWGGHYLDGVDGDGETASLKKAIEDFERVKVFADVCLLLAGTNDVIWTPGDQPSKAEIQRRYNGLLNEIWSQNSELLIIASTIPQANPDSPIERASRAEIIAFNTAIEELIDSRSSDSRRLFLVDGYGALNTPRTDINRVSVKDDPATGAPTSDGIHPTDQGYAKLGDMWFRAIEAFYWEVEPLYTGSTVLGGDWRYSPTFKSFNDQGNKEAGWKYHETLGWIYTPNADLTDFYFYHEQLGWVFTTAAVYPDVYVFNRGGWFYFNEQAGGNRQLFNYWTSSYENF